jgi:hypothetical protein
MSAGTPASTGAVVSRTTTWKLPVAVRPPESVTEHDTVVSPSPKKEPLA